MLERIELKDFKSWRGHQTIGPFQPFTSIIGPNGSGKSNLMDAISFVLGITSAHLRSERLRDLIYRGRRLRRETDTQPGEAFADEDSENGAEGGEGDARDAWVKAVYKDETGKEFIFQRSVTMAGGSEYKLNNRVVTYTRYNAALEAHNILVKAKNFLVFQGDVEAVARQSPKDLCRLIEQISGSLELAKEYETTKAVLDKATTLSTESFHSKREVAKEFKAFKEHQSESKRLTKLRQEKDEIVLQHVLWKLFHIQVGIDGASSSIESTNAELVKLRKEQGGVEREIARVRKAQAEVKTQISSKERGLKGKEKSLDQEAARLVSLRTQIEHAIRKIENSSVLSGKVRKDEDRQKGTVSELQRNLAQVETLAKEAEDEQRRLSQKKGQALSEADLAEYRQLKAKANTLLPDERASLDDLRRREKTLRQEIEAGEEKAVRVRRKETRLEAEISDLETRKDGADRKRENLESDRSKAKKELEHLQSERTRISQLETETNEKLQACYAKLIQAGSDRKQSEKETRMKETIATLRRIFPGDVHGRVVDLCKPTQTKYQTAVSVVLGRNIDGIVVNHEKTAIECINYLRTQRLGQAMFIPLDSIQVKPTNDKFRNFARGARLAIDVIEFDPQFDAAMQHACGNSLICDTMDVARYVCYDKQQDVKAVTLEGTVIHKSGSITGGQSAQGAGRKWDEKEITNLGKQRDSLMNYLGELSKARPRGKSDDILMSEISRCDSELALVRDDLSATELRLNSLRTEIDHARKELSSTTAMLRDRRASLATVEQEAAIVAEAVHASEDDVFADFCTRIRVDNIREYEDVQLRVAEAQTEARMRYTAQMNRLQRQLEFENEQLEHTQSRLRVLDKNLKADQRNLSQLEADKVELEREIYSTERDVDQIRHDIEDLQIKLAEAGAELDDIKRRSHKATKAFDRTMKEVAACNDTIAKLGSERASIYRRCKIEDLELPLEEGSLANVSLQDLDADETEAGMDVDEPEDGTQQPLKPRDYGLIIDFTGLSEVDRENGADEHGDELESEIARIESEIQHMAPTSKAAEKMGGVQAKLIETEKQVEKARKESATAREAFNTVRKQRTDLFNKAYTHISDRIDGVYKSLTKGNAAPMGGVAYLNLEDTEEPYLAGVKYHAMPPMKRFRDMDQLSGGEQTVAALALLLAIHSYRPAPFFVLDEVDAALDNTNVTRVARYLRDHSSETFQFLVISLKDTLYERSNSLVGVYRDQDVNSSKALTLDLTQYEETSST